MKRFLPCVAALFVAVTALKADTVVPNPPPLDLYLLVGQSNMAGRGPLAEEDKQPVPRVLILDKENQWVSKGEPVHFDKPVAGVGLSFAFAKLAAAADPSVTVGLVPCAVGGTSIAQWKPGGPLYQNAIARMKVAMEKGKLKAILWHQGESECASEANAKAYAEKLAELIESFRKDLNAPKVPVVIGELGGYLSTNAKLPFWQVMNEQIDSVPGKVALVAVVSSQGLGDKGDHLHFSSEAQKEFGKRYFEALQKLEKTATP